MNHKKRQILISGFLTPFAALSGFSISAHAATYYVSKASGASDFVSVTAAVNTPTKPFLTIQKALDQAKANPGLGVNEIIVEPGTYPERLVILQTGLTLKARNDAKYSSSRSILKPAGPNIWDIVSIEASSVTLRGFEVDGSLAYVDGTQENGNEGASTNGITIQGAHLQYGTTTTIPAARNVKVATCVVHDNGGAGIAADGKNSAHAQDLSLNTAPIGGPDYISIEDNAIYNNCYWSRYAASGVSLHNMTNSNTGDTGVHNIIRRNNIYGNKSKYTKPDKYPSQQYPNGNPNHTDGNGIILDFDTNKNPATLIENNLVYINGGRGIYMLSSSNVTVRNNSTYQNNQDPDISGSDTGGELVLFNGLNVKFLNNVSYGFNSVPNFRVEKKFGSNVLSNNTIRACTYYGEFGVAPASGVTDWNTTFYGNPYYTAPATGNFYPDVAPTVAPKTREQSQTVIDRASNLAGDYAPDDYYLTARPQGAARDRGAIERSLPAAAPKASSSGS